MTIQIPEAVQWLVPIVVGTNWPEGDEDALRRLSEAWKQAATAIGQATSEGTAAAQAALDAMQGQTAESFGQYWDRFVAGDGTDDEQFLSALQRACGQLADGCDKAALNIEYTKLSIIAALLILAAQIAAMIAAAGATWGASTAGIPIAQAATELTVRQVFQELIRQLATYGVINVGADALSQGVQFADGGRQHWDVGKTVDAGIAGTIAGTTGGTIRLGGMRMGTTTTNFGAAALRGAGEGALAGAAGNYVNQAAQGDFVPHPQNLVSGATSGGVGGALGETVSRHQGLSQTWHRPDHSDYTAGPNTLGWRFTTEDGAVVRANANDPDIGSWNSGAGQHLLTRGGPNNVNVDEADYRLPTWQGPGQDVHPGEP